MLDEIKQQAAEAAEELCRAANLQAGQIVVIGCSTSEICGSKIGTESSPEVAQAVLYAMFRVFRQRAIILAAQCCEHLNRAVVTERFAALGADYVNAIPQPKAGGAFAAAAYQALNDPVVLEHIRADAGLDIGGTLIGMHLKHVAVPLRLEANRIGNASLLAARTRPKYIGGERVCYDDALR